MGNKILVFILGLALGAGACAAVLINKSKKDAEAAAAAAREAAEGPLNTRISDLEAELAASKNRLNDSQASNDKLASKVQDLMKKQAEAAEAAPEKPKKGLAALFGGDGTNGISEAMSGMMKSAMKQQMDGKMAGLKSKLNLTADQEKAIRDILDKQMSKGTEIAEKVLKGEMTKEELTQVGKEAQFNERDEIKALLTPEQLVAYDEYEKEQKASMARLAANAEMLQMQQSLQLTAEQQDKVFDVLVKQTQTSFDPNDANQFDFAKQAEAKKEALKAVLTPDQFERYTQFQAQQLKLIDAFLPKAKAGAAATPAR